MELKNYQKNVISNLTSYLNAINLTDDLYKAWEMYWESKNISVGFGGMPSYNDTIEGTPHVCIKVPTGGGKTFIACAAVKKIFDAFPSNKERIVIWLVPSDSILTQTIKTLSDTHHFYRQRLDADFSGRVGVYTKDMLLYGQNFSPDTVKEMLTICVLSYSSLRINSTKKDVRKIYQENENLFRFSRDFKNKNVLLDNTPDTALIQVLRSMSPVIVVDESHNAESNLSIEMLKNLNPSFVLDLTATPREKSNIISYVDARILKKENMVKLPIVVFNRAKSQSVIQDAIQFRGKIEELAKKAEQDGGDYIRPIVLFQAQPQTSDDNETFDKIKKTLIDIGIDKEQIAIKTSKINDLDGVDLLDKNCKIRYIITVNALKEGWDCPFAYILASLANKTSQVDVEQILGRVLRQPYAKQHSHSLLNTSYVLTCSSNFSATVENIVQGLNRAGFTKKDYRVGETSENEAENDVPEQTTIFDSPKPNPLIDIPSDNVKKEPQTELIQDKNASDDTSASMARDAQKAADEYTQEINKTQNTASSGEELGNMTPSYRIQEQFRNIINEVQIPQFFKKGQRDLFGDSIEFLEKSNLSEGFSLAKKDAEISFDLPIEDMYRLDVQDEGEAVLKRKLMNKEESQYFLDYLSSLPQERKLDYCINTISCEIGKANEYADSDVKGYVRRIVGNMTDVELSKMENAIPTFAYKIKQKIDSLMDIHREKVFYEWLQNGKIICENSYKFPENITLSSSINTIPKSLYESEPKDINKFEQRFADILAAQENILWWHRNLRNKDTDFRINGFINHYPDFIAMTQNRIILLIETKGDFLNNDDTKKKTRLGSKWQSLAGNKYRYFMVFESKEADIEGAYSIENFIKIVQNF